MISQSKRIDPKEIPLTLKIMATSDDFGARPNVGLTHKDKHNVCDWVAAAVNEAGWKDRAVDDIKVLQPLSVS